MATSGSEANMAPDCIMRKNGAPFLRTISQLRNRRFVSLKLLTEKSGAQPATRYGSLTGETGPRSGAVSIASMLWSAVVTAAFGLLPTTVFTAFPRVIGWKMAWKKDFPAAASAISVKTKPADYWPAQPTV